MSGGTPFICKNFALFEILTWPIPSSLFFPSYSNSRPFIQISEKPTVPPCLRDPFSGLSPACGQGKEYFDHPYANGFLENTFRTSPSNRYEVSSVIPALGSAIDGRRFLCTPSRAGVFKGLMQVCRVVKNGIRRIKETNNEIFE